ncbi:MFS transporter [Streptomyces cellulosae]|uniref:MFS transporter n=1 Tax=Streptomyces cellulosae TaxID=1968 RepID=UPI00068E1C91|nr:MFS transporter [Streptomyces cellulosae]
MIATAQLMVILDGSIMNIARPAVQGDLGLSDSGRSWVITGCTLAFGGLPLLGGRVADQWGRRRTFVIGSAGCAAVSAVGGRASSGGILVASRVLQGGFAAPLMPSAPALIAVTVTGPKERALALSVFSAVAGGGLALGLIMGGLLTQYLSWRWCLLVNIPPGTAAALAPYATLAESRSGRRGGHDLPGALLSTAGVSALVLGLTNGAEAGGDLGSRRVGGAIACGAVLLAAFVAWEVRASYPLLPQTLLTNRDRIAAFTGAMLTSAALFAVMLLLTFNLQELRGHSPVRAGLAFLPLNVGIGAASVLAARMRRALGAKRVMLLGGALGTAGLTWLGFIGENSTWAGRILPAEILVSLAMALVFVSASGLVLHRAGDRSGSASGLLGAAQQIGGAFAIAVTAVIAPAVCDSGSSQRSIDAETVLQGDRAGSATTAVLFPLACGVIAAFARPRPATPSASDTGTALTPLPLRPLA